MVKLDLEINEIIGLAEMGRINEKKLRKFLKAAGKDELEDYIIKSATEQAESDEETEKDEDEDENLEEAEKDEDL